MAASQRLQQETAGLHRRLERSAFARALSEKRIGRRQYADYLHALSAVVATVSDEVRRRGTARERFLLGAVASWLPLLQADLEALGGAAPENAGAQSAAHELARQVRTHVGTGSAFLAGVAYVLVGSHQGNRRIAPGVAESLDLEGVAGTRYLRATERDGDEAWGRFRASLDEALEHEGEIAEATRGAIEAFEAFELVFDGLAASAPPVLRATSLNPDAGDHAIPQDPALIELSSGVADCAMRDFPYLRFRFGERGDRFARSDGAWLMTLCGMTEAEARRQIDWLCRVLSTRGIPTVCLEHHLRLLYEALRAPDGISLPGAERLDQLARELAARRAAILSRAQLEVLAPPDETPLGRNFGEVLLSAVADQCTGVAACAGEIRAWAEREPRLDARVSRQIGRFVEAALAAAGP